MQICNYTNGKFNCFLTIIKHTFKSFSLFRTSLYLLFYLAMSQNSLKVHLKELISMKNLISSTSNTIWRFSKLCTVFKWNLSETWVKLEWNLSETFFNNVTRFIFYKNYIKGLQWWELLARILTKNKIWHNFLQTFWQTLHTMIMFISKYTFRYWCWTGKEYLGKIIIEADLTEKDFFSIGEIFE